MYRWPLVVLLMIIGMAVFSPFLSMHDPFTFESGSYLSLSFEHWLGTNKLGQDVWSQLLAGTRTSLLIGLLVACFSTALSVILGLLAGYIPWLDRLINGVANVLLVLPSLLLILLFISFTGGGMVQLVVVLSLLSWPGYMRLIRSAVLSLKEREFVKTATMFGGSPLYVLRKHLLPHITPFMKAKFILSFRTAILTESGLAFLGLGDPNFVSWGSMLNAAFSEPSIYLSNAWIWIVLPPVLMLIITTISLAFLMEERSMKRKKAKPIEVVKQENEPVDGLCCKDVTVSFNQQQVVKNVSFRVKPGEIVSIIGPSGSGKTTLARAMYGLLPAHQWTGDVRYNAVSVRNSQFSQEHYWRTCSFIYQDARAAFNPLLTLKEQFMEMGVTEEEAKHAVEQVSLPGHVLEKYPFECSGGMLSRAMIALAFVNEPDVVIADECTSALDPILKKEIVQLLEDKVHRSEVSLIFITHDLDVAYAISNRTFRIDNHMLKEEATAYA
ncbi:ATP-binding cassette domain-containing protein [Bacillus massiliigorillae]|uniref:ATP-binding cassette domain-containing protein n=1 Tax=Bacillus massiliigorillae TaxID=1243664 RepID=UPI0005A97A4B|nr:ATP-binding cassette domain-containing protein [Bacillus massiliigorillae]